jgi:AcrR family transcriptional regulator
MAEFIDTVWIRPSRGKRTGQPTLSREQIIRTAIEMLDADGAAGLSMRRLGSRLGSGATSLYWYVATKDDLLELAVDEVFGEVYVPDPDDTGWRVGASIFANQMRQMLLRHPWVIGQLGVRPNLGPNAMRMGERSVVLLEAGAFDGMALSHASSLLMSHAIGSATIESAFAASVKRSGATIEEMTERLEPYLDQVAADHPHYDKWRHENAIMTQQPEQIMADNFAFGLERVLDGLESWLANKSGKKSAKKTA